MTWFSRLTRRPATLPFLVALLGAGISIAAAFGVRNSVHEQAQARFDVAAEQVRTEMARRFRQPQYGLRGIAGSYAAFGQMSRAQFASHVASRDMAREFPGVRGFGFIQHVQRGELERFVAAERADGAPDFSVRQLERQDHDDLYVIKLVEPLARNAAAQGLDVGSEGVRREAIERAVRTGQPGLTAPITLVQDGGRAPGFLLYLPIYREGTLPADEAERRAALLGVLYAPIVAAELMHDATQAASSQVAFALIHGRGAKPGEKPVFDTRQPMEEGAARFEATRVLDIAGSAFTLTVRSGPAFDAAAERWAPATTLGGGLLLTAMLAYLVHLGTAGRRRAERLAQRMTVELDRLAMVARHTSDAVVITGLDRRITWVNAAFERISGYSLAEALGHSPCGLLQCAATEVTALVHLRAALDAGEPYRGELLNRAKDGRAYRVELEIQPLRDARGAPSGFMAVESDVTAARQAAAQLATERQRLEQIVEGTGAGTWEVDLVTGEDRVNPTYAAMLGYTIEAYQREVGPAFMDLVHPEDREATAARRQAHLAGQGEVYEVEFRMRHRSGRWVWILSHGKVVSRDTQGRPLAMSGIHLDISARKHAEQALRDVNERFALAASSAGIGVWELDPAAGTVVWDEGMFALYGLQRADGLQPLQIWAERLHPEDGVRAQAELAAALAGERDFDLEFRIRWTSGETRHIRAAATVVRDAGGAPLRMIGVNFDVTERRAADDALRAAKAFLEQAGRVAGVGGWRVELDTGAIEWSDETCRIHGEPTGHRPALDAAIGYYTPEVQPLVQKALEDAIAQCGGFDLELPLVTAQGRNIWVRTVGEVVAENGRALRVVGAFQDVTARRALEAELRERNEVISNVLENLPCGLSVFNGRLELVASNGQYRSLLDFPDTLFEGVPRFEDFIRFNARRGEYGDGDVETAVGSIVARAMAPTVAHRFERVRPNGVPLEVQGAPMPGGGFVTTYTDISERKRADAEVQRSAALLRGAIDAVDEAFVLYDPQDRLVFCNDKYRQIYAGVAELIVPGVRFEDLVRAGVERGNYLDAVGREDAWIAERVAVHQRGDTTIVQRLDDGRTLRIIERKLPDGHIVGFRIDVTELARAVETAQDASKAKSQFLANMSHEIRTPMNAILGMLALLRKTDLTPRQADYAAKTDGAARSLLGLLNDILDFSKVEAGKMALEAQPFRVDRLLRDLSVILSANLGGKPVELLFDIDPALPRHLTGDAMRLQQVLINLGGNAIKFTEQGTVVVSVAVAEGSAEAVTLDIAVQDSGIGIAPENQARIFSGFTQAEASTTRRFGGTGLGLAICQRLVGMMGGELGLQSELGRGSRFHFRVRLPLAALPADELPAALPGRLPGDLLALVVDDNAAAREVLERMGRSLGWRVQAVDSGAAALAAMAANPGAFGAVFVDWQMPGMDGWQTCRHIRALSPQGHVPLLVMVTAHGRESLAQRSPAEQGLIDGFVVKPVTASMLYDAVVDAGTERAAVPAPRRRAGPSASRLAGLRVLVVEDNANNQQVALELLEDEGARVQIAGNGQIAVEAVAAADPPFDAVLMDLQMPVMDGYTATRQIRQDLLNTALPIVAMTANAMRSDREACLAAGMNDHIGKPFDLDRLVQVLRRLTGRTAAAAAPRLASVPQALAAQAAVAGVDLDAAVARLGGKPEVYRRMLRSFLNDLGAMPANLETSLAAGDTGAAARQMHTLKGLAATLGMKALAAQAAGAEKAFAADPGPGLAAEAAARAAAAMRAAGATLAALQGRLDAAWPSAPAVAAVSPTGQDAAALRAALNALARLLAESDLDAVDATARLRERHAGQLGTHLAPLEDAVTGLDFGTAASVCATLLAEFES